MKNPVMYVFAGNNGSGKSSFRNIIGEKLGIQVNIDPDSLGRKYDSHKDMRAGREALLLVEKYIEAQTTFSMETTLSSKISVKQIKRAKDRGFKIVIYYLGVSDITINLKRISQRVERGGHDIPTATVLRRSNRTLKNLITIVGTVDEVYLVDNTSLNAHIFIKIDVKNKKVDVISEEVPQWADPILNNFNKLHEKY